MTYGLASGQQGNRVKYATKLLAPFVVAAATVALAPQTLAAPQPITGDSSISSPAYLAQEARPKAPKHDPLRTQAASRGGAGRWGDSNVSIVWNHAPTAARNFWMCVRHHESFRSGHYRAANRRSSARGAGQWLTGTWRGVARYTKVNGQYVARGYSTADKAPAWVQDAVFLHVWRHGGQRMWRGTHCGYGT